MLLLAKKSAMQKYQPQIEAYHLHCIQVEKKFQNAEKELNLYEKTMEKEVNTSANNISETILKKIFDADVDSSQFDNIMNKNSSISGK